MRYVLPSPDWRACTIFGIFKWLTRITALCSPFNSSARDPVPKLVASAFLLKKILTRVFYMMKMKQAESFSSYENVFNADFRYVPIALVSNSFEETPVLMMAGAMGQFVLLLFRS